MNSLKAGTISSVYLHFCHPAQYVVGFLWMLVEWLIELSALGSNGGLVVLAFTQLQGTEFWLEEIWIHAVMRCVVWICTMQYVVLFIFNNSIADRFPLKIYWQILLTVLVLNYGFSLVKPHHSKGKKGWLDSDPSQVVCIITVERRESSLPGYQTRNGLSCFFQIHPRPLQCTTGSISMHFSRSCSVF